MHVLVICTSVQYVRGVFVKKTKTKLHTHVNVYLVYTLCSMLKPKWSRLLYDRRGSGGLA